jgi:hypothetical protein
MEPHRPLLVVQLGSQVDPRARLLVTETKQAPRPAIRATGGSAALFGQTRRSCKG